VGNHPHRSPPRRRDRGPAHLPRPHHRDRHRLLPPTRHSRHEEPHRSPTSCRSPPVISSRPRTNQGGARPDHHSGAR
jgi:hypothetical protein